MVGMTADVLAFTGGRDGRAQRIRNTVRTAIAARGVRVEDLAPQVGMTPATLWRRLGGKGSTQAFYADEIELIAEVLGFDIGDIYRGVIRVSDAETSVNSCKHTSPPVTLRSVS